MLRSLSRLLRTPHEHPGTPPAGVLMSFQTDVEHRLQKLERAEVERAAEHAAVIDRLERLYKRVSARIARAEPEREAGESALSLRQRLRGTR